MAVLPFWFAPLAAITIAAVMLSLGLMLDARQIASALQRRMVLAAIVFAVVVPVPILALLFVLLTGLRGPAAAGILLMAVSPGAPVALRRAIDVGGSAFLAPTLHLAIVTVAVITVPVSILALDVIFSASFRVSPAQVARQILVAQLVPLGLGALLHTRSPRLAAWLEPRLARTANLLLLLLLVLCVLVLRGPLAEVGWMPFLGGLILTSGALGVGTAFAGRDHALRPQAALAAAMRNPGLALLIASVNDMPSSVVAAVAGYALGAAGIVMAYVARQARTDHKLG